MDKPSSQPGAASIPSNTQPTNTMSPGDQAPAGTPGTGGNICPACQGSGKAHGAQCPNCQGTGRVVEAIGGA
jgi:hypothetical protein